MTLLAWLPGAWKETAWKAGAWESTEAQPIQPGQVAHPQLRMKRKRRRVEEDEAILLALIR